jgi:hypothetical protein
MLRDAQIPATSKAIAQHNPVQDVCSSSFITTAVLRTKTASQVQGLAICDSTNWVCCTGPGQQGDEPQETDQDSCPCSPDLSTAIQGASQLPATASLPSDSNGQVALISYDSSGAQVTVGSISYPSPNAAPSTTSSPSQITTIAAAVSTTSTKPDSTSTESDSASSSSIASPSTTSDSSAQPSNTNTPITSSFESSKSSLTTGPSSTPQSASPSNAAVSTTSSTPGNGTSTGGGEGTPSNVKIGLGAGLGVGLGAALAGLATALFIFYKRRRAQKENVDPYAYSGLDANTGNGYSGFWGGTRGGAGAAAAAAGAPSSEDRSTAIWQGDVSNRTPSRATESAAPTSMSEPYRGWQHAGSTNIYGGYMPGHANTGYAPYATESAFGSLNQTSYNGTSPHRGPVSDMSSDQGSNWTPSREVRNNNVGAGGWSPPMYEGT